MADSTREQVILALKALLTTALDDAVSAATINRYILTRNHMLDPKQIPNGTLGLYLLEGASPPPENGNVQTFMQVPVLLSMRAASAASECDQLPSRVNNMEAVLLAALYASGLTANSRTVAMEVTNIAREIGQNEIWSDITLTLTFPA